MEETVAVTLPGLNLWCGSQGDKLVLLPSLKLVSFLSAEIMASYALHCQTAAFGLGMESVDLVQRSNYLEVSMQRSA